MQRQSWGFGYYPRTRAQEVHQALQRCVLYVPWWLFQNEYYSLLPASLDKGQMSQGWAGSPGGLKKKGVQLDELKS